MSGMDEKQAEINEAMRTDNRSTEAAAAMMLKLIEYGVPADVLQMLTNGSMRSGVRPGALAAALFDAITVYTRL